jgi:hypothetical protein
VSLEVEMYLPKADDTLIKTWLDRLLQLGMQCELHPDFSFLSQTGYLPIKLRNLKPTRAEFENQDFSSGFEFYLEKFEIASMPFQQSAAPKGLGRLFGKKPSTSEYRVSQQVDEILRTCRLHLTFRFSPADVFELRLADLSSIILAELTDGIRYLPSEGEWMKNQDFANTALSSIEEFERSLEDGGYKSHPFESWIK